MDYATPTYVERAAKLDPEFKAALDTLMTAVSQKYPDYQYTLAQGYRTVPEQNALYAKGPGVTNAKGGMSYHNYGLAADVYPMVNDKILSYEKAKEAYDYYGQLAAANNLVWGGSPGFKPKGDFGHVQLKVPAPWQNKDKTKPQQAKTTKKPAEPAKTSIQNKPKSSKEDIAERFRAAFRKARMQGKKIFMFDKEDGRGLLPYTTELA